MRVTVAFLSQPSGTLPGMASHTDLHASDECRHDPRHWGRTSVVACATCGLVQFFGPAGALDPAEGMAALFGTYDLIGSMPAVGAPAPVVLAYRPGRGKKDALGLLPTGHWLRVGPELWVAAGEGVLMLATPDWLMVDNLTRGA